jgi:hypothetical protein
LRAYLVLPASLVVAAVVLVIPGPWAQTELASAAALAFIIGMVGVAVFEVAARRASSSGHRMLQAPVKPWNEFWRELDRSRRHERRFAILAAVKPQSKDAESDARSTELRHVIRSVDSAWEDSEHLYLLLPETDGAGAGTVAARLRRAMPESVSTKTAIRWVTFPDDAVTGRGLLHLLRMPVGDDYAALRPRGVTGAIAEAKVAVADDDF